MLNIEQYIVDLENKNGYCNCPNLSRLFSLKKEAISLEEICDCLKEDFPSEKYQGVSEQFRKKVNKYYQELTSLVIGKKLRLILHTGERYYHERELNLTELEKLRKKNPIITVHCSNCNQQIDLVE